MLGTKEAARVLVSLKRERPLDDDYRENTEETPSHHAARYYLLPTEARIALNTWLILHLDQPYPTLQEKHDLMSATGLTMTQIDQYYSNKRRRDLRKFRTQRELIAHLKNV